MHLKYFLRGAGTGFIIAAVISLVAFSFYKPTMSDAEIIRAAGKLGMVMQKQSDSTADKKNADDTDSDQSTDGDKTEDNPEASGTDKKNTGDNTGDTGENSSGTGDTGADSSGTTTTETSPDGNTTVTTNTGSNVTGLPGYTDQSNASATSPTETPEAGGDVNIAIAGGETSATVGQDLYQHGLVDDPEKFDRYLESTGADSVIQPGNYSIPSGSSYEEIRKIITTKK